MAVCLTTFHQRILLWKTLYENITGKSSSNKAESKCYIKTCVKIGKDSKEFFLKNCVMCMVTSICH